MVVSLLQNAVQHTPKGGAVSVDVSPNGSRVDVRVTDTGGGIPEADRAAVFHAFARLDTSRNRETGGFGLGLAIVARIASLHRGRVIAGSSRALGGARLAMEWPAADR